MTVTILVPAILVLFNLGLFFTGVEHSVLRCSGLMALGLFLWTAGSYVTWGISTGNLLHPDGETIWIQQALLKYYFFIALGLFLFLFMVKAMISFFQEKRRKGA